MKFHGIAAAPAQVADQKQKHLQTLTAPLDVYWEEALIGFADHFVLCLEARQVGFYCINKENQLVCFYVVDDMVQRADAALADVVRQHRLDSALAGTNDPLFLSVVMDRAQSVATHTYLFGDNNPDPNPMPTGFGNLNFSEASTADFQDIFKHYMAANGTMDMDSIQEGFEDIKGYIRSVLEHHHIFLLRDGNALVATSECRFSKTQKPYADLGMIVAEAMRRRGLGSYLLSLVKAHCYRQGARPICSCEAGNIASRKAVEKAGFASRHRVVQVSLKPD